MSRINSILVIILCAIFMAGCAKRQSISKAGEEKEVRYWKMTSLRHMLEKPFEIVVKNQDDWIKLWRMNATRDMNMIRVDFKKHYIVYIAAYAMVEVEKVTRSAEAVKVYVNMIHADRKPMFHGGWVSGFAIKIKKTDLPVEIIHTDKYLVDFS